MQPHRKDFYRSSELARRTGVSTDTLRHYERYGLLPKARRSLNRYREYPLDSVERVHLIRSALSIGFTIAELSQILRERDHGKPPCQKVYLLAQEKLSRLRSKLKELESLESDLTQIVRYWRREIARRPPGQKAALLDWLSTRKHHH